MEKLNYISIYKNVKNDKQDYKVKGWRRGLRKAEETSSYQVPRGTADSLGLRPPPPSYKPLPPPLHLPFLLLPAGY